ncbi:MAG: tRNA (adenosine(37)-N6)-dimethylallyltransferase MiaA [Patescibacteria group bacterium]|nr:tRNA (adenosine(37)-N6)-dimethylallyltransferase MiaA [Patescibacteria group bacterium]
MQKIIVIAGPTASGKTELAIELAKKIGGEIINADSRSIYIGMDIGTGKPTLEERQGVPHHLFDIITPDQQFSVAEYKKLAEKKIKEIQERGKTPILVGGTGLYIDSVVYGYELPEIAPDYTLRKELEERSEEDLYAELAEVDPETAEKIDPKNKRRIIRALEIYYGTGRSKITQEKRKKLLENVLYFAIDIPRETLYQRINERVDKWIKEGFVEEVKKLLEKYPLDSPGMSGIGYKQIGLHLTSQISKEEATSKFKQGDRNLAKRQLTWFKRNKDIIWVKGLKDISAIFK